MALCYGALILISFCSCGGCPQSLAILAGGRTPRTASSAGSLTDSRSHSQPVLSYVGWEAPEGIDFVLTLTCRRSWGGERSWWEE